MTVRARHVASSSEGREPPLMDSEPPLRLLPVPIAEPWAALRVAPRGSAETDEEFPPSSFVQEALRFDAPSADPLALLPSQGRGTRPGVPMGSGEVEHRELALHLIRVLLEVMAGVRPPAQLLRCTARDVMETVQRRHALAQRGGGKPARATVRSVHVSLPVATAAEVVAVIAEGPRVRALALRLEPRTQPRRAFPAAAAGDEALTGWRITALDLR